MGGWCGVRFRSVGELTRLKVRANVVCDGAPERCASECWLCAERCVREHRIVDECGSAEPCRTESSGVELRVPSERHVPEPGTPGEGGVTEIGAPSECTSAELGFFGEGGTAELGLVFEDRTFEACVTLETGPAEHGHVREPGPVEFGVAAECHTAVS